MPSKRKPPAAAIPEHWPARSIVNRKLTELIPYSRNARLHDEVQISQIVESIKSFGWTIPLVIDEKGNLIAGHGRALAAEKLGLVDVPCLIAKGWSEEKRRAYILADNKLAANSDWNSDLLKMELRGLRESGFEMSLTGFSGIEMTSFLDGIENLDLGQAWQGMPEFDQPHAGSARSIVVHFKTDADFQKFATAIGQSLTAKVKSTWYPAVEPDRYADKRYAQES